MAILGEKQFVERLNFFNGQRLFASDLDSLDSFHQQMRWLHNQSLHQPGVGRGFAVTGKKGDKVVTLQEGYAIDSDGREIVLTLPRVLQVPPVAGVGGQPTVFDLAVSYPSDTDLEVSETRQGICVSPGAVRRREEPIFCWVEIQSDGQPKDAVLKSRMASADILRLARVKVLQCKLYSDVSIAERRNARPPQQPYIGSGLVSSVAWTFSAQPLSSDQVGVVRSVGPLTAMIDTKSAGFRTAPAYFVEIRGKAIWKTVGGSSFSVDGVASVLGASASTFTVSVDVLVQRLSGGEGLKVDTGVFTAWEVSWIGVEG
jgi:hypothetical protein